MPDDALTLTRQEAWALLYQMQHARARLEPIDPEMDPYEGMTKPKWKELKRLIASGTRKLERMAYAREDVGPDRAG